MWNIRHTFTFGFLESNCPLTISISETYIPSSLGVPVEDTSAFSLFGLQQHPTEWVVYEQQTFIPHSSGDWKFKIRCQQTHCLVRARFLVHRCCLLHIVSSHRGRAYGASGASFIKALMPSMRTAHS